jgi:hypothetical protein
MLALGWRAALINGRWRNHTRRKEANQKASREAKRQTTTELSQPTCKFGNSVVLGKFWGICPSFKVPL